MTVIDIMFWISVYLFILAGLFQTLAGEATMRLGKEKEATLKVMLGALYFTIALFTAIMI